jgi:hypothetical protein
MFEGKYIDREMEVIMQRGEELVGSDVRSMPKEDLRIYITYATMHKHKLLRGKFNENFSGVLYAQFDKEFQHRADADELRLYRIMDFMSPLEGTNGVRLSSMLTFMPDDVIISMVQRYKYAQNLCNAFKQNGVDSKYWSAVLQKGTSILTDYDNVVRSNIASAMQIPEIIDVNTAACETQDDYDKAIYKSWIAYNAIMSQAIK